MRRGPTRRRLVRAGGAVVAAVGCAGCVGNGSTTATATSEPETTATEGTTTTTTDRAVPSVTFAFERVGGGVRVTHVSGNTLSDLNSEFVVVASEGDERTPWLRREDDGSIAAGDTVVHETRADRVRVVWGAPDTNRTAVLADAEVPR